MNKKIFIEPQYQMYKNEIETSSMYEITEKISSADYFLGKLNPENESINLSNIDKVQNLSRAIKLFDVGNSLKDYTIISSNCYGSFLNYYLCNPQSGPSGSWMIDIFGIIDFLRGKNDLYLKKLISEEIKVRENDDTIEYIGDVNGLEVKFNHYFNSNPYNLAWKNVKTKEEIKDIWIRRIKRTKDKKIFMLGILSSTLSKEKILELVNCNHNVVVITDIKIVHERIFYILNWKEILPTAKFYYQVALHFWKFCSDEELSRFIIALENIRLNDIIIDLKKNQKKISK